MSRSGYSDECDGWDLIRWRGAVASAIRGRRGQAFLRELAAQMDAMPVKRLIAEQLADGDSVCAIGVVGRARGVEMSKLDPDDRDAVAKAFGISPALVAEITFENDERNDYFINGRDIPKEEEKRWKRMREWVESNIAKPEVETA